MELVHFYPSVSIKLYCQKHHVQYLRSLWAVLEVASQTKSSQNITSADFSDLPQALEAVRCRLHDLLDSSCSASKLADLVWNETEKKTIQDFLELKPINRSWESGPASEKLALKVSAQNAGLLCALWSLLESDDPDHPMNLEISSLPAAVVKIRATLDQLLLPAINDVSCLSHIVQRRMAIEIVDQWSADQKQLISLFVGWILPTLSYSSSLRLN